MIRHLSFKHGWFYHYRLHERKTELLCSDYYGSLMKDYLLGLFDSCPDDPFLSGPRCSGLKKVVDVNICRKSHFLVEVAAASLANPQYSTAHSNVQVFALKNDSASLAVEVPVWWRADENRFCDVTGKGDLSGHIDLLSRENGKFWVWDYKPGADKERFAATQVLFYALMLSTRTGIPLSEFMCGWFDESSAFVFDPSLSKIL